MIIESWLEQMLDTDPSGPRQAPGPNCLIVDVLVQRLFELPV